MTANGRPGLATYVGLFCALGVPLLVPLSYLLWPHARAGFGPGEAIAWGLTAGLLCILLLWERLPLSTIGLGRLTWNSFWWGIAGAVAIRIGVVEVLLAGAWFSGASFASSFARDIGTAERLGALPLGVVVLLALRAGVTEEILFRGYGIERLAAVSGNRWFAAMVSLAIFTIAHLGGWDLTYLLVVFPAGLVLTLLYLWRRDLWANMIAHVVTDASSLVLAYAIAHHLIPLKA